MSNGRQESIDYSSRSSGYGSLSTAITDMFYGFNNGLTGNPVPYNTENQGLTFITRPRLNLSYDNLGMLRSMTPLASSAPDTVQSAIRAWLDPVGNATRLKTNSSFSSNLIDQQNAFIPLLSNALLSLNGWPDKQVRTYTSRPGIYNETWSMVDDISLNYTEYELTLNFRNIQGDPITPLFAHWVDYASMVYLGVMSPHADSIIDNEIDYVSRIYRITLDSTKTYVQKIMACGYCYPTAAPIGTAGDFNSDTPLNMDVATQLSVSFKCNGFMWNDPFLIYAFNRTVATFNTDMRVDKLKSAASIMRKLTALERDLMRGRCYPRIDPRSNEMEWYAYRDDYDSIMNSGLPSELKLPTYYTTPSTT